MWGDGNKYTSNLLHAARDPPVKGASSASVNGNLTKIRTISLNSAFLPEVI